MNQKYIKPTFSSSKSQYIGKFWDSLILFPTQGSLNIFTVHGLPGASFLVLGSALNDGGVVAQGGPVSCPTLSKILHSAQEKYMVCPV